MKKLNNKAMIRLQFKLPDTNPTDGLLSNFLYAINTEMAKNVLVHEIVPIGDDSPEHMLLFSCEVCSQSFEEFEKLYERTFRRKFSVNWDMK